MIVDGKKIAQEIQERLSGRIATIGQALKLAVVVIGNDTISTRYIRSKEKFGATIGIEVIVHRLAVDTSTEEIVNCVQTLNEDASVQGIIIQLPLPEHVDSEEVLAALIPQKDVDSLSKKSTHLSPIVCVVREIFRYYNIDLSNKNVVVIGQGKLVGLPITKWLQNQGVTVQVVDTSTKDVTTLTKAAHIIISGAGNPGFITPDMISKGVVLIDAGTSEQNGELRGDIDPLCAEKAALFTPVPGGVGPMTVAFLFSNVVDAARS